MNTSNTQQRSSSMFGNEFGHFFFRSVRSMMDRIGAEEVPEMKYCQLVMLMRFGLEVLINAAEDGIRENSEDTETQIHEMEDSLNSMNPMANPPLNDLGDRAMGHLFPGQPCRNSRDQMTRELRRVRREYAELEKTGREVTRISQDLHQLLDGLEQWIKSPVFSPDHPYGSQIMLHAQQQMTQKSLDHNSIAVKKEEE